MKEQGNQVRAQATACRCLGWSQRFSFIIAREQKAQRLEVHHLLAGICLGCWEKILGYWKDPDVLEQLLDLDFRVKEPRLYYWIRLYKRDHRAFRTHKGEVWTLSEECAQVEAGATQLALARGNSASGGRAVLIPEDYLLAAIQLRFSISARLIASGIDVDKLAAVASPPTDTAPTA